MLAIVLECKAPDGTLQEFLSGENRFAMLEKSFPEESRKLRAAIEADLQNHLKISPCFHQPLTVV